MEGVHRQATLLFVLNSKLYQEIPPPSWKSSETEVVYDFGKDIKKCLVILPIFDHQMA
jgi:hypothetical protein